MLVKLYLNGLYDSSELIEPTNRNHSVWRKGRRSELSPCRQYLTGLAEGLLNYPRVVADPAPIHRNRNRNQILEPKTSFTEPVPPVSYHAEGSSSGRIAERSCVHNVLNNNNG